MVSLENLSSVLFFQLSVFICSYRDLNFVNLRRISAVFIHLWLFLTKFSSILLQYVKTVNCSVIDFISKDR